MCAPRAYQYLRKILLLGVGSIYFFGFSPIASAQTAAECDAVLIPSVESRKGDYAILQAFAKVNVDELYDKIAQGSSKGRGGGVSYAGFGVDFQQSNSRSDFKERVEKRLVDEKFNLSNSESRAYYRQRVSDAQVVAWLGCVTQTGGGGAVLLSARDLDSRGFNLVVTWLPQTGVGNAQLELRATGGTINGNAIFSEQRTGRGAKTYLVRATSKQPVKVLANIAGSTDTVMATQAPTKAPVICLKQAEVKRYSKDDNFLNALPNMAPCLKHHAFTGKAPDIDAWYRLSVLTEGTLTVQLSNMSEEFELQIRNSIGEVVARPTPRRAKGNQSIKYSVTTPGEYFVRPQPYSGSSEYDLEVSFEPLK